MRSTEVAEPGGFEMDNQLPRLGYRGRYAASQGATLSPEEFIDKWSGNLRPVEVSGDGLRTEDENFLAHAGLPRLYHCDDIKIDFRATAKRLTTHWKEQNNISLKNAHGFWAIADVDTCGGACPYFLCIKQVSGQVFCVWIDDNEPNKIGTCLLSESLGDMAECMTLIQEWHINSKGSLKRGNLVIELCRVFEQHCFTVPNCKDFWMTSTEAIFNADALGDEYYPDKVSLKTR